MLVQLPTKREQLLKQIAQNVSQAHSQEEVQIKLALLWLVYLDNKLLPSSMEQQLTQKDAQPAILVNGQVELMLLPAAIR